VDEPIRILRVIARLNVGGPALHVAHLSHGLDERGYETLLVAGSVGASEGSMEYVAEELGVRPLFVPSLQRDVAPLADAASVRELLRLIRDFRPHILHTHTAKAGAVGRVAARLAGSVRPQAVVHTFHGHVLRGYFGPLQTEVFRRLERRLAAFSDALIAVSPEVRDDLVRLGVAPSDRITVIRLGLDLDDRVSRPAAREPFRESLGLSSDAFVVAWLGRMTEIKRVDDLLASFAALRNRREDAELLLVGDGPLRGQLEQRAGELGIAAHCHFVGFHQDVAPVFAACDAVALTSANEGTPVTLIEALAAERPVVSTNVGGVSDVVEHGRSGFLCQPHDVGGIAAALEKLAEAPDLRARFGRHGRDFVVPRYSVPRLIEDVDSLYRSLLGVPRESRTRPARIVTRPLPPALSRVSISPAAKRLRILIVSQYFPPEVGATQSRMQAFAEYLALRGHQVTVIAEFPNHPHGVIPQAYRGRLVEDDRSNPYRVIRVWVKANPEKTQATRIEFYLSFMAMAAAVAPLAGRADVVLATSPPLFTALAGLAIAKAQRVPFVLDVRDLWPAAAVSLDQIGGGLRAKGAEAMERFLYRQASQVVAVTRPFCEHIDAIRGRAPSTVLIPNGTLEQFFVDGDRDARTRYGLDPQRYLVTFAGTHGIAQGLPAVLEAAALVDGSADFAFVGEGPVKDALVRQATEAGIANVRFLPQVPLEQIPPLLGASDALLVPLSSHPTFAQFVPSKMIDFMATGRPVVVAAAGEAARLLEIAGGGIVVPPEDPGALAGAVRHLAENPAEAHRMGERGRQFARRRLRSVQAERVEALLLDVVGA
jgi:glycosyltransferase involved in cell wall biosynthesis